nr:uncharacterized protein LOC129041607 [Pongo pygmaeus]
MLLGCSWPEGSSCLCRARQFSIFDQHKHCAGSEFFSYPSSAGNTQDLAGRPLLPVPTLTRTLPSSKHCCTPSNGTATHAEPIGTRCGAGGSSRSAHERTLATGGQAGCNRLLSWQFCVPRLRPGHRRTLTARRSFTTSRSSGPGTARARLCASRRWAPTGQHLSQKVQPIVLSRRSSSMASASCSPGRPLASPEPGAVGLDFQESRDLEVQDCRGEVAEAGQS